MIVRLVSRGDRGSDSSATTFAGALNKIEGRNTIRVAQGSIAEQETSMYQTYLVFLRSITRCCVKHFVLIDFSKAWMPYNILSFPEWGTGKTMLIDFHTHIFPPDICQHRERYCTRDPWFKTLYGNPRAFMATAEDLIAEMDVSGVDASVTFSFGWTDPGLIEETNSYILDAMWRYPGRLYGMAVLQPTAGTRALSELERCARSGMIGLGELMPHGQGYRLSDIPLLTPFMEIARSYNLLVLSHCSEPVGHLYPGKGDVSLSDIVTFLSAFSDIRFIAAHWGGGLPFYCIMPEIERVTKQVWYDTAATPYLYQQKIFPVVAQLVGAERILFASDYGLMRQGRVIEHIRQAGLDAESLALVLGGNAQRLLGL